MILARNIKKHKPFCWQDKEIIRFIRKQYSGKKRTTAQAVYLVLSEIESNYGKKHGFPAYYIQIGDMCGKSSSTAKRYCDEFIKFGILQKENCKRGKQNIANKWLLLECSSLRLWSGYNPD